MASSRQPWRRWTVQAWAGRCWRSFTSIPPVAVTRQLLRLTEFPDVEEIHTVTGESVMLLKVRTRDTQTLEHLLERIQSIEGFTGTRSYIALTTYLERGPSSQV